MIKHRERKSDNTIIQPQNKGALTRDESPESEIYTIREGEANLPY